MNLLLQTRGARNTTEVVKYITALAIVAALSCAAFAAHASPAGHPANDPTSLSVPDKPVAYAPVSFVYVKAPQFRYAIDLLDVADIVPAFCPAVLDTRQRAPQITVNYLNQFRHGDMRKTKGVAVFNPRTLAVARSTI